MSGRVAASSERVGDGHVDELDGLRAVAITLVMFHHFAYSPDSSMAVRAIGLVTGAGWIGVDLFFVLSGFLITGICLDHGGSGFFRAFYARRALRILPIYAVVLGVIMVFSFAAGHALPGVAWLSTFTTNILLSRTGDCRAVPQAARHLWSLAVEEQFYLVWPFVVAALSTRRAALVAAAAVPAAIVFRAMLVWSGSSLLSAYLLTPARMDSLAIGALLAFANRNPAIWDAFGRRLERLQRVPLRHWVVGLMIVCLVVATSSDGAEPYSPPMQIAGFSLIAALAGLTLAVTLSADYGTALRHALRYPAARAVGRYSYAMYLIHVPINVALRDAGLGPRGVIQVLAFVAGASAVTYVLAATSWRVVEYPALRLKRHFPYEGDGRIAGSSQLVSGEGTP